jgi:TIR domain
MADIFISYAREDLESAGRLAATLQEQGWSVFWDRTIPAGKSWREVIGAALADARCIVVLWSQHSVDSHWVIEEADFGLRRRILIPAFIESAEPPFGFGSIQAADLSEWTEGREDGAIQRFLGDVAGVLGPAPTGQPGEAEAGERRRTEEQRRQQIEADVARHVARTVELAKDHSQKPLSSTDINDKNRARHQPKTLDSLHRGQTPTVFSNLRSFPVPLVIGFGVYAVFSAVLILSSNAEDQKSGFLFMFNCAILGFGLLLIASKRIRPSLLSGAAAITQCLITLAMIIQGLGEPSVVLLVNGLIVATFALIGWLYWKTGRS